MHRTPVTSSNIRSIGYDSKIATLEVEFTSGDIYQYFNLPEHLYQQFLHASSHGQSKGKLIICLHQKQNDLRI